MDWAEGVLERRLVSGRILGGLGGGGTVAMGGVCGRTPGWIGRRGVHMSDRWCLGGPLGGLGGGGTGAVGGVCEWTPGRIGRRGTGAAVGVFGRASGRIGWRGFWSGGWCLLAGPRAGGAEGVPEQWVVSGRVLGLDCAEALLQRRVVSGRAPGRVGWRWVLE